MRYVIATNKGNEILAISAHAMGSVRATIQLVAQRERARDIYRKVGRDIPSHFDYVLATVESSVIRGLHQHLRADEFVIVTQEKTR